MAKKVATKAKKAAVNTAKKKKTMPTRKDSSMKKKVSSKTKPKATKAKTKAKKTIAKKKVLSTPKGYNTITPYLIVDNATNALEFYKKVFGAKEKMRMEKPNGQIGHSEIQIGDSKIMLADEFPEMGARSPKIFGGTPVSIHFYTKNVDEVIKHAIDAGATLLMPVDNMFYGDRSGSVEDPFGHRWYISTHIEDVTPAMMKKRAAAMFGKKG